MRVDLLGTVAGAAKGMSRLAARVEYTGAGLEPDCLWIEVEQELAPQASRSGNPFLVGLLPLAMALGEPLEIVGPLDPVLLRNAYRVQRIWRTWYPELHMVALSGQGDAPAATPAAAAVFFSGGVDSFYTLLREDPHGPSPGQEVDDLILIAGMDITIGHPDAFALARANLAAAADALGKRLTVVRTNLRQTRWNITNWARLSHGSLLAMAALALEGRYRLVFVPSSVGYRLAPPWGSHPLVDPLFGTRSLEIRYDGSDADRTRKVACIAQSPIALRHLRVCWQSQSGQNCGACEKCLRTMVALELAGALARCEAFPAERRALQPLGRLHLYDSVRFRGWRRLAAAAANTGRHDLARRIDKAISRSLWRSGAALVARAVGRVSPWLGGRLERLVWHGIIR